VWCNIVQKVVNLITTAVKTSALVYLIRKIYNQFHMLIVDILWIIICRFSCIIKQL